MNKTVPPLDDTTKDHVEQLMCILEGARSKGGGLRAMPWTFPYLSKKKVYLIHIQRTYRNSGAKPLAPELAPDGAGRGWASDQTV